MEYLVSLVSLKCFNLSLRFNCDFSWTSGHFLMGQTRAYLKFQNMKGRTENVKFERKTLEILTWLSSRYLTLHIKRISQVTKPEFMEHFIRLNSFYKQPDHSRTLHTKSKVGKGEWETKPWENVYNHMYFMWFLEINDSFELHDQIN